MKTIIKIIKTIFLTVLLLLLIIMLYKLFAKIVLKEQLPTIFGYGSAVVISGSMQPNLNIGDYIIVKEKDEYYINNIVLYVDDENSAVTHRIVKKDAQEYVTKGDNNNTEDKPITQKQIKGEVVLVLHGIGNFKLMLSNPVFIRFIVLLMIMILKIYF